MSMIFWSSVGAAIGGFIGVIGFFLVRLYIERQRISPTLIQTYLCGNNLNQGQPNEAEGELMHHHGIRVSDSNELKKLEVVDPVWEWTKNPVGRGSGDTTIYGPYSTDFAEPGLYSATFRIKGTGFSRPGDIINDVVLIELDVNRTIPKYMLTTNGMAVIDAQNKVARKFVRVSELARGGWLDFELKFYSDAQGIWEYRAFVYDGLDKKFNDLSRFGSDVRVLFDRVIIHKLNKLNLPWT